MFRGWYKKARNSKWEYLPDLIEADSRLEALQKATPEILKILGRLPYSYGVEVDIKSMKCNMTSQNNAE